MKPVFYLIASIFLAACAAIPVPMEPLVLEGERFTETELDFIRPGTTMRQEIADKLGNPTLWLAAQCTLVYGLRQAETGAAWFIGAGPAGAAGLVQGESKKAVFFVLDAGDVVTHWGRAPVNHGETWLSAATEWAASQAIETPGACDHFAPETPAREQGLVYFYRPRDYQHVLPLVPPASKLPLGLANYADIFEDGRLVGQIRRQSYVVVRVSPGVHSFSVNADTDYVVNPDIYRSATIRLEVAAETAIFVEVGIVAGLGKIEPLLVERIPDEATRAIEGLRESW